MKREIIRPGVTRFATAYLTMQSMMEKKDCLRKMVVDSKWEDIPEVKTKKRQGCYSHGVEHTILEKCVPLFEDL